MMNYLLVFLGGGLGALSRFALARTISELLPTRFPLGILVCNLIGCLLIGFTAAQIHRNLPEWLAPLLIVGFLGGFTTFSTFSSDNFFLLKEGRYALSLSNILLSIVPGILAVWLGFKLSELS